jgi:hypothetical protein
LHIVAHRGLWETKGEQNSLKSLKAALDRGFGIETDFRDVAGRLVVSHDMPTLDAACLESVLCHASRGGWNGPRLLLDVKADGMALKVSEMIRFYHLTERAFCFDMSTPQIFAYRDAQVPFLARYSEFELTPVLSEEAAGIWVDSFLGQFLAPSWLLEWLTHGKFVCYVSPELHGRSEKEFWAVLKSFEEMAGGLPGCLALCTDYPERAAEYFSSPGRA